MVRYAIMRLVQFIETSKLDGFRTAIHDWFYINRTAIVVEKDLGALSSIKNNLANLNVELKEISEDIFYSLRTDYALKNRYLKAKQYLGKGYRAFAIIRANKIIGDIWYAIITPSQTHPDLKWLGIICNNNDIYMFDMYIHPKERGKFLAVSLQYEALQKLREKGFQKAYGFFWLDNVPASWTHRTLKFKEIKKVEMLRFLTFRRKNREIPLL